MSKLAELNMGRVTDLSRREPGWCLSMDMVSSVGMPPTVFTNSANNVEFWTYIFWDNGRRAVPCEVQFPSDLYGDISRHTEWIETQDRFAAALVDAGVAFALTPIDERPQTTENIDGCVLCHAITFRSTDTAAVQVWSHQYDSMVSKIETFRGGAGGHYAIIPHFALAETKNSTQQIVEQLFDASDMIEAMGSLTIGPVESGKEFGTLYCNYGPSSIDEIIDECLRVLAENKDNDAGTGSAYLVINGCTMFDMNAFTQYYDLNVLSLGAMLCNFTRIMASDGNGIISPSFVDAESCLSVSFTTFSSPVMSLGNGYVNLSGNENLDGLELRNIMTVTQMTARHEDAWLRAVESMSKRANNAAQSFAINKYDLFGIFGIAGEISSEGDMNHIGRVSVVSKSAQSNGSVTLTANDVAGTYPRMFLFKFTGAKPTATSTAFKFGSYSVYTKNGTAATWGNITVNTTYLIAQTSYNSYTIIA